MTDPRTPCTVCGAMILLATAARNDGLCMPCRNGTRQSMEEAKARNKEMREELDRYENSAAGRHWNWLVEQEGGSGCGFSGLLTPDQRYFAVSVTSSEVWRGGIGTYFDSYSGAYYEETLAGLEEMGLVELGDVLKEAKMVLFGDDAVPKDEGVRWEKRTKVSGGRKCTVSIMSCRTVSKFCWTASARDFVRLRRG